LAFLYLYDVSARNKKEFNRVKRRFYYRLNQLFPKKDVWRTKSAILVQGRHTRVLDDFFRSFRGFVVAYKASVNFVEELD
jgi:hypothetical protein